MQKAHNAAKNDFWHNRPDTSSPITETELNRIETNIDTIDDRVVTFDVTKANQSDLLTCVSGISLNTTTGILTITLKNGTTSTLDTGLAKLAINFDYDDDPTSAHYQQIILEMKDGTYKYIDLSALITQYEFVNTSTIVWTIESDGKIKANVPNGSITSEKLQPNYLADITTQANRATGAVTSTEANRLEAEGWAKGTQNGTEVGSDSPYYHNNAKYYKEAARQITGNKVDTFNGRDGMVVPQDGDYDISQIAPTSGASEGQVPMVQNVGTEQNPDYKLRLGTVSTDPMNYFAICYSSISDYVKTITIPGYKGYSPGQIFIIEFQQGMTSNNPSTFLNVNNLGNIQIDMYVPGAYINVPRNSIGRMDYVCLKLREYGSSFKFDILWHKTPGYNDRFVKKSAALAVGTTSCSFAKCSDNSSYGDMIVKVYSDHPNIKVKSITISGETLTVTFKEPLKQETNIVLLIKPYINAITV